MNQAGEFGHALDQMTYRFALDKDRDVRSFVMSFVDPETLEKQREKEMKAAVEVAEAAIEARAEESSNFDEDDEEEETETDEQETEEEEEHKDVGAPMQDISPMPEKETTDPMEEITATTNIPDEDEIMSEVDPDMKDDKIIKKSTSTAVTLPSSDKKE